MIESGSGAVYGCPMGFTVAQIAQAMSARVEGDASLLLNRPRAPRDAKSDDLALAMDKRYAEDLEQGAAQAAVLWHGANWQDLGLQAAIFVERPRYAMAHVTRVFDLPPSTNPGIHDSAVIDPSAQIANGASIGAFCVIGADVKIGHSARILSHVSIAESSEIGDDALIHAGVRIGSRVTVGDRFIAQPNAIIGADGFSFVTPDAGAIDEVKTSGKVSQDYDPQAFTRINSLGGVKIGHDVEIGAGTAIDRGTISDTEIGDGTKIDNLVQVGHNVKIGRTCLLCGLVGVGGSAVISDRVVLGGQVGVADHVTVGANVIAAGKAGISSNVPPNRAIMGNPAILMEANIESYKQYRRLPRLAKRLETLEKFVSKTSSKG